MNVSENIQVRGSVLSVEFCVLQDKHSLKIKPWRKCVGLRHIFLFILSILPYLNEPLKEQSVIYNECCQRYAPKSTLYTLLWLLINFEHTETVLKYSLKRMH